MSDNDNERYDEDVDLFDLFAELPEPHGAALRIVGGLTAARAFKCKTCDDIHLAFEFGDNSHFVLTLCEPTLSAMMTSIVALQTGTQKPN